MCGHHAEALAKAGRRRKFSGEHRACPERSRMGCQPVLFGSLPKSLQSFVSSASCRRLHASCLRSPGKNRTRQTLGSQRRQRCCGIGILPMFVHGLEVRATHLTNDSALRFVDELDDLRNLFARRQFLSDRFERLARVVFRSID
jgi:hypothetical protein